jgi:hypothetical protein
MKHLLALFSAVVVFGGVAATSLGAPNPNGTGQPSQTCVDTASAALEPGHAADARGSAFNENGGIAGSMYAGNGQTLNTPANAAAVSQYDVACFQVTQQAH